MEGDICVVQFARGHLTDDENIELMGRELFSLVEQFGCRKVVLSLAGVNFITSSVLGKMITLHRKLHRNKGMLVICDIPPAIAEIMRTSKLMSYFNIADNLERALAAFQ